MRLRRFASVQISKLEECLDGIYGARSSFQIPLWLKELTVRVLPLLIIVMIPLSLWLSWIGCFDGGCSRYANNFGLLFIAWWFQFFSIWGLFRRKKSGWNLLFYASIFNVIGFAITLSIIGLVFSAIIGWYILFQIRSMYK